MSEKIRLLREKFTGLQIDAYLVPTNDEFQNEYVPNHLRRLQWLTEFSGSNGVLVITQNKLLFFTDGRYLLQAEKELGNEYEIFDMYSNSFHSTLTQELGEGKVLGYSPMLHSVAKFEYYQKISKNSNFKMKSISDNLIDLIWNNKPQFQPGTVTNLDLKYAGISAKEKLNTILSKIDKSADYLLITKLDSISWLLNTRGSDIPFNPFFLSYMIIKKSGEVFLFTDSKLEVNNINIKIHPLNQIYDFYSKIISKKEKIQLDKDTPTYFFSDLSNIILKDDPIMLSKACKNEVELKGMEKAHILDAVAVCKFLHWLENNIDNGIREIQAAEKLLDFRKKSELFVYPSFATISAFAENGAIIHYSPSRQSDKILNRDNIYLFDSGGQYLCGTTDITRTVCFGIPNFEQKKAFTMVLKGLIRLSMCIFPNGTDGSQIDSLARYDLWQYGMNYAHGTGHGVGHFLSVHEGPQGISKGRSYPLSKGMVLSNEPGYYEGGEYGIRIENLMSVEESSYENFLQFKTLTLVPIAKNLIEERFLTIVEKEWLNQYHQKIKNTIGPLLNKDEAGYLL